MITLLTIVLGALGVAYAVWPARRGGRGELTAKFGPAASDAQAAAVLRRWSQASGELADGPAGAAGRARSDV